MKDGVEQAVDDLVVDNDGVDSTADIDWEVQAVDEDEVDRAAYTDISDTYMYFQLSV